MFSIAAAFSEAKRLASSTMELQRTRGHSLSSSAAASPSALLDRIRDSVSAIVESAGESRGDDGDRDKDDSLPWLLEEAFCLGARAGVVDGDGVQRLSGWTLIAEACAVRGSTSELGRLLAQTNKLCSSLLILAPLPSLPRSSESGANSGNETGRLHLRFALRLALNQGLAPSLFDAIASPSLFPLRIALYNHPGAGDADDEPLSVIGEEGCLQRLLHYTGALRGLSFSCYVPSPGNVPSHHHYHHHSNGANRIKEEQETNDGRKEEADAYSDLLSSRAFFHPPFLVQRLVSISLLHTGERLALYSPFSVPAQRSNKRSFDAASSASASSASVSPSVFFGIPLSASAYSPLLSSWEAILGPSLSVPIVLKEAADALILEAGAFAAKEGHFSTVQEALSNLLGGSRPFAVFVLYLLLIPQALLPLTSSRTAASLLDNLPSEHLASLALARKALQAIAASVHSRLASAGALGTATEDPVLTALASALHFALVRSEEAAALASELAMEALQHKPTGHHHAAPAPSSPPIDFPSSLQRLAEDVANHYHQRFHAADSSPSSIDSCVVPSPLYDGAGMGGGSLHLLDDVLELLSTLEDRTSLLSPAPASPAAGLTAAAQDFDLPTLPGPSSLPPSSNPQMIELPSLQFTPSSSSLFSSEASPKKRALTRLLTSTLADSDGEFDKLYRARLKPLERARDGGLKAISAAAEMGTGERTTELRDRVLAEIASSSLHLTGRLAVPAEVEEQVSRLFQQPVAKPAGGDGRAIAGNGSHPRLATTSSKQSTAIVDGFVFVDEAPWQSRPVDKGQADEDVAAESEESNARAPLAPFSNGAVTSVGPLSLQAAFASHCIEGLRTAMAMKQGQAPIVTCTVAPDLFRLFQRAVDGTATDNDEIQGHSGVSLFIRLCAITQLIAACRFRASSAAWASSSSSLSAATLSGASHNAVRCAVADVVLLLPYLCEAAAGARSSSSPPPSSSLSAPSTIDLPFTLESAFELWRREVAPAPLRAAIELQQRGDEEEGGADSPLVNALLEAAVESLAPVPAPATAVAAASPLSSQLPTTLPLGVDSPPPLVVSPWTFGDLKLLQTQTAGSTMRQPQGPAPLPSPLKLAPPPSFHQHHNHHHHHHRQAHSKEGSTQPVGGVVPSPLASAASDVESPSSLTSASVATPESTAAASSSFSLVSLLQSPPLQSSSTPSPALAVSPSSVAFPSALWRSEVLFPSASSGHHTRDEQRRLAMYHRRLQFLEAALPSALRGYEWSCAYSLSAHGASLRTLISRVKDDETTLMLIRDSTGGVFGGFASERWTANGAVVSNFSSNVATTIRTGRSTFAAGPGSAASGSYHGNGTCFVFTFEPREKFNRWRYDALQATATRLENGAVSLDPRSASIRIRDFQDADETEASTAASPSPSATPSTLSGTAGNRGEGSDQESFSVYRNSGRNRYYQLLAPNFDGFGFGGGNSFALHLDADLDRGTSGYCETFLSPPLSAGLWSGGAGLASASASASASSSSSSSSSSSARTSTASSTPSASLIRSIPQHHDRFAFRVVALEVLALRRKS